MTPDLRARACNHFPGQTVCDWCRPTPEPAPADSAWLIERGQPEKQVPTVWWTGQRVPNVEQWTTDANKAKRFATRAECEAQIDALSGFPIPSHGDRFGRASEHVWFPTPEPAPAVLIEALGDILDLSKGEPRMSGGSTFPANAHRMGRIHNRARKAFGEEPLTILSPEPAPAGMEAYGMRNVAVDWTASPPRLVLDTAPLDGLREAVEFAAREFRRLGRTNSALQMDAALRAALRERT